MTTVKMITIIHNHLPFGIPTDTSDSMCSAFTMSISRIRQKVINIILVEILIIHNHLGQ